MRKNTKIVFQRSAGKEVGGAGYKNQYIKPEEIAYNITYSFSYNPVDQPDLASPNGFKQWWDQQKEFFDSLTRCSVRLFCEFSQHGRFHFHGFIRIKSYMFYLTDVQRLNNNGSCEMDTISDYERWYLYCLKNQLVMQEYISREIYSVFQKLDPDIFITISSI